MNNAVISYAGIKFENNKDFAPAIGQIVGQMQSNVNLENNTINGSINQGDLYQFTTGWWWWEKQTHNQARNCGSHYGMILN